ncbi:28S ribosomal protein S18a, mitochondrial [Lamellibrachia satsuma]|nr:28S ribosomal protein S18a, mitochondrial [Lamellibrachia satsuma]
MHSAESIPSLQRSLPTRTETMNDEQTQSSIPEVSPNVNGCRSFATTTYNALKEITVNKSGKVTTVEGMPVESTQDANVLRLDNEKGYCAMCPNKLDMKVSHTDVLILSQFLRPDGCLLPKRVTGLCTKGQRRLARLVHRAQRAGLMPELRPDLPGGKDRTQLKSGHKWRQFNIFYKD